jgi:hypothetical protein
MRRIKQSISLLLLITFVLLMTACPKPTPEQKASFKHQAVSKVDTLADSIKFAQGVNESLYNHHKISGDTAIANTEKLRTANSLARQLGEKVKAIDPNANSLPTDLSSTLDEITSLLQTIDNGKVADLAKAISDVVGIATELKGLIQR